MRRAWVIGAAWALAMGCVIAGVAVEAADGAPRSHVVIDLLVAGAVPTVAALLALRVPGNPFVWAAAR